MRNSVICSLFFCAVFGFVLCEIASGQDKNSVPGSRDEQSIQALLKEVRLMRLALERATSANLDSFQAHLLVEHLRIQQEHVDRLSRQLDLVGNEVVALKTGEKQLADRIKEGNDAVKTETDAEEVKQSESELKKMDSILEQQHDKVQTRNEQESQLASQLQSEQLKLDEMSSQLDKLLRKLQPVQPSEAAIKKGIEP